jgi:uncharacterized short protein YbdD (DUF466 family)
MAATDPTRVRTVAAALSRILRAIAGAPDYERYLEHMRTHHPTAPTLTARAFAESRWEDRYSRPGSRCC